MLSYIFIFQRALNLSTKRKLNKQTKKKKGQRLKIVIFFAGNILYYTDFILIIINLCLY